MPLLIDFCLLAPVCGFLSLLLGVFFSLLAPVFPPISLSVDGSAALDVAACCPYTTSEAIPAVYRVVLPKSSTIIALHELPSSCLVCVVG